MEKHNNQPQLLVATQTAGTMATRTRTMWTASIEGAKKKGRAEQSHGARACRVESGAIRSVWEGIQSNKLTYCTSFKTITISQKME